MSSLRRIWIAAVLYWIAVSVLCCWLYPCLMSDTLVRYAPMAEAFARGDWPLAFHPRFGVLIAPLAGVFVRLFGVPGDQACQIVAFLFHSLAAVPVWALVRRVFGDGRVAWGAAALTLLAPECFVFALDGLREPARMFGLALCLLAFVGGSSAFLAAGLFVLVTLRTDLFVISGAILFAWCVQKLVEKRYAALVPPVLGWTAGAFSVMLMTYLFTGYWLPGAQFIGIYLRLTGGAA